MPPVVVKINTQAEGTTIRFCVSGFHWFSLFVFIKHRCNDSAFIQNYLKTGHYGFSMRSNRLHQAILPQTSLRIKTNLSRRDMYRNPSLAGAWDQ